MKWPQSLIATQYFIESHNAFSQHAAFFSALPSFPHIPLSAFRGSQRAVSSRVILNVVTTVHVSAVRAHIRLVQVTTQQTRLLVHTCVTGHVARGA